MADRIAARHTVLFDLDGTLTDPPYRYHRIGGVCAGKIRDLGGRPASDTDSLHRSAALESFEKYYGFSRDEARRALAYYREYFAPTGIFENTVYPGIPEALQELRAAGRRLCVATSKPEVYARRILEHFSLDSCFDAVCGATLDETRVRKTDVIAYALETLGAEPDAAVMVGDRLHDIEGAHACGLPALGVTYGYGPQRADGGGCRCTCRHAGGRRARSAGQVIPTPPGASAPTNDIAGSRSYRKAQQYCIIKEARRKNHD